jgi:hypothetical protein
VTHLLAARRCRAARGLLIFLLAATGCRPPDRAADAGAAPETEAPDPAYPPELSPGVAVAAEKTAPRSYRVRGWTDRADSVRLEVEDGHDVLFGPATVPVRENEFSLEFRHAPTNRDHIFLYLTDAEGNRLAVVPVDTTRALTTAGTRARP